MSEHMEPEEETRREPSHISRTHDGKWHICRALRSDRNGGWRGYRLVERNCLSCGIPISHKVFCFALAGDETPTLCDLKRPFIRARPTQA